MIHRLIIIGEIAAFTLAVNLTIDFLASLHPIWERCQEYLSQKVSRHGLGDGSKQNH